VGEADQQERREPTCDIKAEGKKRRCPEDDRQYQTWCLEPISENTDGRGRDDPHAQDSGEQQTYLSRGQASESENCREEGAQNAPTGVKGDVKE
jgi:hypothetical protein